MAKDGIKWADQLVQLLGLDKETISSQIIPFLDSFDSRDALQTHLEGLLETDDARARNFISTYTDSRFPQPRAPVPEVVDPPTSTRFNKQGKAKKSLSTRAGIGKPLPPRQIDSSGVNLDDISAAFGGQGTVYIKNRDDDLGFFSGTGKTKGRGKGESQSAPDMPPEAQPNTMHDSAGPADQTLAGGRTTETLPEKRSKSELVLAPTPEMLAIDQVIDELTNHSTGAQGNSGSVKHKRCFCRGRIHAVAPNVPLCLSCGLVICSALYPTPLSPLSSCPSCASSPLLSATARSDLMSRLSSEREALAEQQRIQAQLIREERARNREKKAEGATMFPELGSNAGTSSSTPSQSSPAFGKHGSMAKAKGIAQDAQRTAKVLSLNMKTHKVTVAKPKAKAKPAAVGPRDEEIARAKALEEDEQTALDGTALYFDSDDDGYPLRFPAKPATSFSSVSGKGKSKGLARWSVRSTLSPEDGVGSGELHLSIRYMDPEERQAFLPSPDAQAAEDAVDEKMLDAVTSGSTSTPSKAATKSVPGAASASSTSKGKSSRRKKGNDSQP